MKDLTKDRDAVVNFAAETHVDRSIRNPSAFHHSNTAGVVALLEVCRLRDLRFLQVSTDEVYGSATVEHAFSEDDRLEPSSPYSASKAAADLFVTASHKTYGLSTYITRSSNNYGPYQFPEKFMPKTIIRAMLDLRVPIYGSGRQVRDWIYVNDNCEALGLILQKGRLGEIYNIASGNRLENLEVVERIISSKAEVFRWIAKRPYDSSLNVVKVHGALKNTSRALKAVDEFADEAHPSM